MKHWKLSPMDVVLVRRWWDYTKAYQAMLEATDTPVAPWYVVPTDPKRRARLNPISNILRSIPYRRGPRGFAEGAQSCAAPKGVAKGPGGQVLPDLY